ELATLAEIGDVQMQMNLCAHVSPLAAGGEQAHQAGDALPLHRVVDVPFFLAALEEPGASQHVEMVRQSRAGNLDHLLNFSDRHLTAGLHQREEDLEATQMREGLEGFDVRLVGGQLGKRQASDDLHNSKYMEM